MLRQDRYRRDYEMQRRRDMTGLSAGQEGQEKTESVSDMESPKNFPEFHTPNAPKGTRGRKFQEVHNIQSWNLSRNFVPFVPYIPQKAFGAYRIVTFPCRGGIGKVTILYAPNAPLVSGVI